MALFKKNPINSGSGRLCVVYSVDSSIRDRDQATCARLVERLKAWDLLCYCADDWPGFPAILPKEKFYPGKDGTTTIEQNNGRQRHFLARFRRKSIVVSKNIDRVNLSLHLFAAVHVNKILTFN